MVRAGGIRMPPPSPARRLGKLSLHFPAEQNRRLSLLLVANRRRHQLPLSLWGFPSQQC